MPKEVIYSVTPIQENEPFGFDVQVGWQKDQDVQVGLKTHGDVHLIDILMGAGGPAEQSIDLTARLGRSAYIHLNREGAIEAPLFETSDVEQLFMFHIGCAIQEHLRQAHPSWDSMWWYPARNQINRLITLLRKARDEAFGKDA